MRIGLDGIPLNKLKTGVGHYTFELAHALALLSPAEEYRFVSPLPYPISIRSVLDQQAPPNLSAIQPATRGLKKHWWTIGLPSYIRRNPFDLFHGTNYDIPILSTCRTVLTIHDLASHLYPETLQTR